MSRLLDISPTVDMRLRTAFSSMAIAVALGAKVI
jgi:hypothetical protein